MGGACCCSNPDESAQVTPEEEPKSFISTSRIDKYLEQREEKPSVEGYKDYVEAHFKSLSEILNKEDISKIQTEMHQHARSKDRLKCILEHVQDLQMSCAQLLDLMKMVALDDHKREIMIELYCHLSDRENFEEQVVAQFSLSDTLRRRTMEKLQEQIMQRYQEHADTGTLPATGAKKAAMAESPQATPKAAAQIEEVEDNAALPPSDQPAALTESRSEPASPPPSGGAFCCCGAGDVDASTEAVEEDKVEDRAIVDADADEVQPPLPPPEATPAEEDDTKDGGTTNEVVDFNEEDDLPQKQDDAPLKAVGDT